MKARILTVLLLLPAAFWGWFLPEGVAMLTHRQQENAVPVQELDPVELSYTADLDLLGKLAAIGDGSLPYAIELSQGEVSQEAEIFAAAEAFLTDAVGTDCPILSRTAVPMLRMGSSGQSLMVWSVCFSFAPQGAVRITIDDATRMILSFFFTDYPFSQSKDMPDSGDPALLSSRILSAYRAHLERQLPDQPFTIEQSAYCTEPDLCTDEVSLLDRDSARYVFTIETNVTAGSIYFNASDWIWMDQFSEVIP